MKARSARLPDREAVTPQTPLPWLPLAYSQEDAARRLGTRVPRLQRLVEADHLPAKVVEDRYLIRRIDLEAYVAGQVFDPVRRRWKSKGKQARVSEGTVYVIGFGCYVKIGFTAGPVSTRLAVLQTGAPEMLVIYAEIPGDIPLERTLHQRFSPHRSYGEWFRREGDLAEWIERGCPSKQEEG